MFLPDKLLLPEGGQVFIVDIPDDGSVPVDGGPVRYVI
jgi:hypothetical protein